MKSLVPLCLLLLTPACLQRPPGLDQDGDGYQVPEDCDDTRADFNPGADEIWYDGADQNCDGLSDYDQDGDGHDDATYGDGDDCDDTDAAIHPDAAEQYYDGIDANCDGLSDYDKDGDGYDSEADSSDGDDCDDGDPDVHPDAHDDWYDGVDANCDGADDYDQDGDGFQSDQHHGDDCDDLDPTVNPDAAELMNKVDDDCDGDTDEVPWQGGPHDVEDQHAGLYGEPSTFSGFGWAIAEVPMDFLGTEDLGTAMLQPNDMVPDNEPELLVSAPLAGFFGSVTNTAQAVYLVAGGEAGALELDDVVDRTVLRFEADGEDHRFGSTVAWVPTVDSDPVPEVLVGAPATGIDGTTAGRAYLFRSDGWGDADSVPSEGGGAVRSLDTLDAAVLFESEGAGDGFGEATCLGNLSGGTGGDVAITAPDAGGDGYGTGSEPGAIAIYSSDTLGIGAGAIMGLGDADIMIRGSLDHTHMGTSLPTVTDIDGSGSMDLVAAAPGDGDDAGWVGLWLAEQFVLGTVDTDAFDYQISGSSSSSGCTSLGLSVRNGADVNGDGYADLGVLCESSTGEPVLHLVDGGAWLLNADAQIGDVSLIKVTGASIPTGLDTLPFSLHADFNRDGWAELVVGSPAAEPAQGGGLVSIFYGHAGFTGTVAFDDPDASFTGPESSWFGYTSIEAMPMDNGSATHLLIGAPVHDTAKVAGMHRPGVVYVLDPEAAW